MSLSTASSETGITRMNIESWLFSGIMVLCLVVPVIQNRLIKRQAEHIVFLRNHADQQHELFLSSQRLSLDLMRKYEPEEYELACQALSELYTADLLKRNQA